MPGRNYTGGGSYYPQYGASITRNVGFINGSRVYPSLQQRGLRETIERRPNSYLAEDGNYPSFRAQLAKMGLQLRDIPADGNCLFRALGDQLEGHCRNHFRHRTEVVNFMKSHRHDFEPFVENDMSFDDHVKALQKLGTHAGNDAIVAFAKLHNVNVTIHLLNKNPILIQGPVSNGEHVPQLHLSYHNGDHYSSVRKMNDSTESPARICFQDPKSPDTRNELTIITGCYESAGVVRAKRGLEHIEAEVAMATNCLDKKKVRQVLIEHDYDAEASIADLLQYMELNSKVPADEATSLTSQQASMTDNGILSSSTTDSNCSSPNSNCGRIAGSVLKTNSHSYTNGKGHKVHFREDSAGSSSGYESLHSYNGERGARPKISPALQFFQKTLKDSKKGIDKKRAAEERKRDKITDIHHYTLQANGVRDVAVVHTHNGRLTRF